MPVIDTTRNNKAGMSRQRLIQLADERTGKISHGKLNLDAEFVTVLQEFCGAYRWYWRRKTVGFDTVANSPTYGLAVSDNSIPAVDCEQIIRALVFGVPGVSPSRPYQKLTPLFDPELQEVALWDTTQGPPVNYFIDPGTSNVLRLTPIPDAAYPVRVAYWAMPNLAFDDLANQIPLVPGYLHHLLVKGLEAQIFRYAIGQASTAYLAAKAEYESGRDDAALRRDFTVEKGREWSSQDEAIRS